MAIKFVPGQGWVTEDGFNVSAGSQDQADAMAQRNKVTSARRAMYGNYDQYLGKDNLAWLKDNIGDSWWWGAGRLDNLANDPARFWKEFGGRSDESYGRNAEIINRYKAYLQDSGQGAGSVHGSIWGGSNLSPAFNNRGDGGMLTRVNGLHNLSNNNSTGGNYINMWNSIRDNAEQKQGMLSGANVYPRRRRFSND